MINKFIILGVINTPIIIFGIVRAVSSYKTSRISKLRCKIEVVLWILIALGLVAVEPIYNLLVSNQLTDSAPMSIFDVVLLTFVLMSIFFIIRTNEKVSLVNKKIARLHESYAIKESIDNERS